MADQSDNSGEDFRTIPVDPKQSTSDNATKLTGSQKTSKGKAFDIAHFFTIVTHDNGEKKHVFQGVWVSNTISYGWFSLIEKLERSMDMTRFHWRSL